MILIRSSDPEGNCNIQTSSLDGEKNLKPRNAVTETQASIENPNLMRIAAQLELEPPNSDLYQCSGTMCIGGDQKIPLTVKNLLLRGALLKNTDWIVGIVGYTGKDTNIMKNAEESKPKQSQIEVKVNNLIILILCFQLVICLVAGVWGGIWYAKYMHEYSPYFRIFPTPGQAGKEGVYLFFTMMILTGTMIPISLIVSLEMVKLVQAMFINNDEDMYFAENDRHCKVFTSSLNEELGQIEFIFSDKTGTLTCNKMEFKNCVIGDTLYGEEVSDQPQMDSKPARPPPLQMRNESHIEGSKPQEAEHVVFNFYDQRITALKNGKVGEDGPSNIKLFYKKDASLTQPVVEYKTQTDLVREFLLILSTCHECLVDVSESGVKSYQGQSPDEITLVDAAKRLGYEYMAANSVSKTVEIFGRSLRIKVLKAFEFNSDRKRASVIIRDPESGVLKLLCKGADSIIIDRLSKNKPSSNLDNIKKKLTKFSTIGLRTLCMAERVLTEEEYVELDKKMLSAASDPNREKLIADLASDIETDLTL